MPTLLIFLIIELFSVEFDIKKPLEATIPLKHLINVVSTNATAVQIYHAGAT